MSTYLFLLLVLACPLMMMFMMRGMHGGHVHDPGNTGNQDARRSANLSLDEMRRRRDELDCEIREREEEAQEPVGSGRR
jgi:DUF2933 family protein